MAAKRSELPLGNEDFIPLVLAGDINVYSVARAFHEAYGVRSKGFGIAQSGPMCQSRIIDYTPVSGADTSAVLPQLVCDFATAHPQQKILAIGCGDSYVRTLAAHRSDFPANVIAPYIDIQLMNQLTNKEQFYALCAQLGIDYPDTCIVHAQDDLATVTPQFEPPFIVKPADGVDWWSHPFAGQKKVHTANDLPELRELLRNIYTSGYSQAMIIQDRIPGDDSYMRVLTCYNDRHSKLVMTCLGHVLLEEHTPKGIGNHAVIITQHEPQLEASLARLLEQVGYTGFSNFDIKYDRRDGRYKVFEINTRQGRSNYYVTAAGANIARLLVEDRVYQRQLEPVVVSQPHLWLVMEPEVALENVRDVALRAQLEELLAAGRWANPLLYDQDNGWQRRLHLNKSIKSHRQKFRTYYQPQLEALDE